MMHMSCRVQSPSQRTSATRQQCPAQAWETPRRPPGPPLRCCRCQCQGPMHKPPGRRPMPPSLEGCTLRMRAQPAACFAGCSRRWDGQG